MLGLYPEGHPAQSGKDFTPVSCQIHVFQDYVSSLFEARGGEEGWEGDRHHFKFHLIDLLFG